MSEPDFGDIAGLHALAATLRALRSPVSNEALTFLSTHASTIICAILSSGVIPPPPNTVRPESVALTSRLFVSCG